jgi:hypothetical protein
MAEFRGDRFVDRPCTRVFNTTKPLLDQERTRLHHAPKIRLCTGSLPGTGSCTGRGNYKRAVLQVAGSLANV